MRKSKLILLAGAAAVVAGSGAPRPPALSAQEVRCSVVMCLVTSDGKMTCVEKPKPCPGDVQ